MAVGQYTSRGVAIYLKTCSHGSVAWSLEVVLGDLLLFGIRLVALIPRRVHNLQHSVLRSRQSTRWPFMFTGTVARGRTCGFVAVRNPTSLSDSTTCTQSATFRTEVSSVDSLALDVHRNGRATPKEEQRFFAFRRRET
ncbi:hypothetical protein AVEN_138117-1 [Araneus ventricosus]|uniref:Uncharacterized protein n=1 Tax=Araneus ventricosus TaxID=182803 RepID=A0A4Y1ZTE5_ARAVE|nr:hypothetical protein AVEN_138117-1 [Araneus ventricosus]